MDNTNRKDAKNKLSIRILFPLVFAGTITLCMIGLMIIFSQYVSEQIVDNVCIDMKRQTESLSSSIEREISSMSDIVNQAYYKVIKDDDFASEDIRYSLSLLYQQYSEKLNGLYLYTRKGELVWGSDTEMTGDSSEIVKQKWFQDAMNHVELILFEKPQLCCYYGKLTRSMPVSHYVELTGDGNYCKKRKQKMADSDTADRLYWLDTGRCKLSYRCKPAECKSILGSLADFRCRWHHYDFDGYVFVKSAYESSYKTFGCNGTVRQRTA